MNNFVLINTKTGESFDVRCNTYACDFCGPKKRFKLASALEKHFDSYSHIRLWTFTLSSRFFDTPETQVKALSRVWHYFITYCRRNQLLTEKERQFQYVKVFEPHRSGYFHLHALLDRYIRIEKLYAIWTYAIRKVVGSDEPAGYCYVVGSKSSRRAAHYVSKYVVKTARHACRRMNYYSKSAGIALFERHPGNSQFVLLRKDSEWASYFLSFPPLLDLYKNTGTGLNCLEGVLTQNRSDSKLFQLPLFVTSNTSWQVRNQKATTTK
jgi:hypothetical protein